MGRPTNPAQPLAILGLLLAFCLLLATTARAAVPPCPAVPSAYATPEDPTDTELLIAETRDLRRELASTCDAVRAGTIETRDAIQTTDARSAVTTSASDIVEAIDNIPAPADSGTEDEPAIVKLANADAIQAEVVKGYNAMREVVWFMAGIFVTFIITPMLRRVIWP